MGCHVMDAPFWALDLESPTSVEAETAEVFAETGPAWSIVTWQFPARGDMPPVKFVWYDGKKQPPRPKELGAGEKLAGHGFLLIGEKGVIYDPSAYCRSPRLIPESRMKEMRSKLPPKTLPRIKGGHYGEWIQACKGGPMPGSNFEHSGPLTEMVQLGNVAIRTGSKIGWNAENLRCTNLPEANRLVNKNYRTF